jgi:hypothetical protein
MLLADGICTSLKQPLSLVTVGFLQGGKQSDVAGLELVRAVGGEATVGNIVFETKLLGFEGLVRPEAVTNQYLCFWLACSLVWGLNTRLSHSKLILESVYPGSEHA